MDKVYPQNLLRLISDAAARGKVTEPNSAGRDASFLCGVSIEFQLNIDSGSKLVNEVSFTTNGCGYVVAVAETLAGGIKGTELVRLEGLSVLENFVASEIAEPPAGRFHCFNLCFDALKNALSDFREREIAQWNGDDPLICTCFGVPEKIIEDAVNQENLQTVEGVGEFCRAGTGCGSCQQLIREIIDNQSL